MFGTRIPEGFTSAEFTALLLDEADIVVTPGNGYGEYGEGYIRLSLTINDEDMGEGAGAAFGVADSV